MTTAVTEQDLRTRLQQAVRALHDVGVERSQYRDELERIAAVVGANGTADTLAAVAQLVRLARAYQGAHRRAMGVYVKAGRSGVVLLEDLGAALHIDTELTEQTGGNRP